MNRYIYQHKPCSLLPDSKSQDWLMDFRLHSLANKATHAAIPVVPNNAAQTSCNFKTAQVLSMPKFQA
jgi:hypothetical protein